MRSRLGVGRGREQRQRADGVSAANGPRRPRARRRVTRARRCARAVTGAGDLGAGEPVEHPLDVLGGRGVVQHAEADRVRAVQPRRGDEAPRRSPRARATSAALARQLVLVATPSKRRRKQTMPSCAGSSSSSSGVSRTRCSASRARSSERSIASRNASSPNVWIESQTFSARQPRVSCRPRSEKLTSPPATSASLR